MSDGSGDNVGTSAPNIEVTLSIAASDGCLLAETTCAIGDCRKLELEVPKTELPSRAEAVSLVKCNVSSPLANHRHSMRWSR